jgi:hypothetical protein
METITYLCLDECRLDGGTQQRVKTDLNHVQILEDALEENAELDPIAVCFDGESYWVVDGFHRVLAYKRKERDVIPAIVSYGTKRDAILASVGANADHKKLPRTRSDKRKAVETLLADPEWRKWSDREIARQACVDNHTVAYIRKEKSSMGNSPSTERKFVSRHGTIATRKIGSAPKEPKPSNRFKDGDYGGPGCAPADPPIATPHPTAIAPPKPAPIAINLKEILLGFLSNLDQFSIEDLQSVILKIEQEISIKSQKRA